MKNTLIIIFIVAFSKAFCCSCAPPSITKAYKHCETIFIGKFTGIREIGGAAAWPIEVGDFEVLALLKGPDFKVIKEILKKKNKQPIISIMGPHDGGCSYFFTKDNYYIVYAYKDYHNGHITTNACTPTHIISEGELAAYLSETSVIEEIATLKDLSKNDSLKIDPYFIIPPDSAGGFVPKAYMLDMNEEYEKVIFKRTIVIWILGSIGLILLVLLFLKSRR
ncbi:MAG: Tissue inhibitor of metalloproteinase [Bacteroidetes bacterium]|jgi:hypothetical protein|nr:Tissue inhibitor of metalloproteinase [Bacteroidota bacterium]